MASIVQSLLQSEAGMSLDNYVVVIDLVGVLVLEIVFTLSKLVDRVLNRILVELDMISREIDVEVWCWSDIMVRIRMMVAHVNIISPCGCKYEL
jgi:hypothetical protein